MAKQTLPVNFKDDILNSSMGGKRRYNLIQNSNGTVSLEDVTSYTQVGSDFGAAQMNQTNKAVNESCDKANVIDDLDDIMANQASGMIAGAKAVADLISKLYNVSSVETVVGKWVDGRNIYRKYIAFGQLNAASPMKKPHEITNIDRCIHIYGSARDTSLDSRYTVPLPFVSTSSVSENINIGVDKENIQVYFTGDKKRYSAMIIIEYIKQSDA